MHVKLWSTRQAVLRELFLRAYRNPFDRFGIQLVPCAILEAPQAVPYGLFQIPFDIKMRVPVFVVDPSTFPCYLFHCVFAFRGRLII